MIRERRQIWINDEEDIKKICIDENLFGAAKEYRAKRMYGYIWNRTKKLDKALIDLFCTSDLATQKIINLIAILRSDRLFFEFNCCFKNRPAVL